MPSSELLEAGERLMAAGQGDRAIELLTVANRRSPSTEIERRLVEFRHKAFGAGRLSTGGARAATRSAELLAKLDRVVDPFPEIQGRPPEVTASGLTADVLRGSMKHHGCVIVRGLIDRERAAQLGRYTTHALDSASRFIDDLKATPDDWYAPFAPGNSDALGRVWTRSLGTLYAGDCPRVLFELIETFREIGLDRLSSDYFGERTTISLQKCAVRRVTPETVRAEPMSKWHQDGRFLGDTVRAINVWIAFTEAGVHAPGMDVVPRRLESIVKTGTGSAGFDWCVGDEVVREVAKDTPPMTPVFAAGDAIIFDEMLLHTTSVKPAMTQNRISSETWFIAESTYPAEKWVPLAL